MTNLAKLDFYDLNRKETDNMKKIKTLRPLLGDSETDENKTNNQSVVRSLSASSTSTFKPKHNKKVDFTDPRDSMSYELRNFQIDISNSSTSGSFSPSNSSQSSPKSASLTDSVNTDSIAKSNEQDSSFAESSVQTSSKATVSSTSSGISSNNISSASSTTSETPSTTESSKNLVKSIKPQVKLVSSQPIKKAPKAVISDDGDIEVEKGTESNRPTTRTSNHQDHRLSVRLIPVPITRGDGERHSQRVNNKPKDNQIQGLYSNHQQIQPNKPSFQIYSQRHQNQLAAAAAAAAAVSSNKYFYYTIFFYYLNAML